MDVVDRVDKTGQAGLSGVLGSLLGGGQVYLGEFELLVGFGSPFV